LPREFSWPGISSKPKAIASRCILLSKCDTHFLDEDVFDFLAKLHPRWRLRGFRDKHLLRLLAERWVPKSVARRHKVIFRAPLDSFHMEPEPPFVAQLLSEESLRKTGYFDSAAVARWRNDFRKMRRWLAATSFRRDGSDGGGGDATVASSLHRGGLADLPQWSAVPTPAAVEAALHRRRSPNEKLKFRQRFPAALFCFGIVFLGVGHRETLVDDTHALLLSPSAA
jgi:hypothetical protein